MNGGFKQNYYTFTLILRMKIVLCSKFPWTKFVNHKRLQVKSASAYVLERERGGGGVCVCLIYTSKTCLLLLFQGCNSGVPSHSEWAVKEISNGNQVETSVDTMSLQREFLN